MHWAIGRLEVHMEIGLPDDSGREQIWKIHTAKVSRLTLAV
jgi:vesicle-fusing ATPase